MSIARVVVESSDLDKLSEQAQKLGGEVGGQDLKREMGFAVMQVVRDHFSQIAQDDIHHQSSVSLGASRTGLYERAREGTHEPEIEADGVSVTIDAQGIAQRLLGGTIDARPGSFLTIPALAIAYGRRAREFDLRLIIFGATGLAALVDKTAAEPNEGDVFYWLVKTVTQRADPTVLPTEEEMLDAAETNAVAYIDQVWSANP